MNKKKLLSLVAALTLVGVVGIGATLAYFTDTAEITNVFTMGHVDVTLTENEVEKNEDGEYVQKDDEEAITEEGLTFEDVMPGETVPKNPTVTVEDGSEAAYVRAQISFEGLTEAQQADVLAELVINEGWTLTDGYYYYKEAVAAGNSVVLFDEVTVPGKWGNEVVDMEFKLMVNVDAIQAVYVDDVIVTDEAGAVINWDLGDATIEEYVAVVEDEEVVEE